MPDLFNQFAHFSGLAHVSLDTMYLAATSALMIGLAGSLHCVGMCSPLVLTLAPNRSKNVFYQIGRLSGYLFLGAISGYIVDLLNFNGNNEFLGSLSAFLIGLSLIVLGLTQLTFFKNKQFHLEFKFLTKIYRKLLQFSKGLNKAGILVVGFSIIFLPCGFLYALVLAAGATAKPLYGATALFFFWLGTLPAVSFGPEIINKLLRPFKAKMPNTSSLFLMGLGILTISYRLIILYSGNPELCH